VGRRPRKLAAAHAASLVLLAVSIALASFPAGVRVVLSSCAVCAVLQAGWFALDWIGGLGDRGRPPADIFK
jgi:hypothetical protein